MRRYTKSVLAPTFLMCLLLGGCAWLDNPRAEIDALRSDIDQTRIQLDSTVGLSDEDRAANEATLTKLEARLAEAEARLGPLLDAEDLPTAVRGLGTIAAPFLGPYGIWALLATNVISGLLTRAKTKKSTANNIVAPLDAARDRDIETALRDGTPIANPGNFLVINKAMVATVHAANGARTLIANATK